MTTEIASTVLFQALRWATLVIWASVVFRLIRPAFRMFTPRRRYLDFMYLAILLTSTNRIWNWLHDQTFGRIPQTWEEMWSRIVWYAFAIGVGWLFQMCRSFYKDGPFDAR